MDPIKFTPRVMKHGGISLEDPEAWSPWTPGETGMATSADLMDGVIRGVGTGRSLLHAPLPPRTTLRSRVLSRRWNRVVRLAKRGNDDETTMAVSHTLRAAGGVEISKGFFRLPPPSTKAMMPVYARMMRTSRKMGISVCFLTQRPTTHGSA